jgi:protein-disulfide isomerase-like protein with CxxC motif
MNAELFFIYDSHCPWSYAATPLINAIAATLPDVKLNLWHSARYEGDELINQHTLDAVNDDSDIAFSSSYLDKLSLEKDSTISANILAWTQSKSPQLVLPLLNAIQEQHFQQGNPLTSEHDFTDIIKTLKLSPPTKVFNNNKLAKDAEMTIHNILQLQEIIETSAIPALLLAVDDNLIMLNHNFYLKQPESIVEAIMLELK